MPVVGIGASAGGIETFRAFFAHMPADSGLAFVVVLHLPIDSRSILPDLLRRWTAMPVIEATDGCPVLADHVYLPPPGQVVTYEKTGCLRLYCLAAGEPRELTPVRMLFNSLATHLREEATAVVLSGTGHDGAMGLKAIKEEGGLTLVQGTNGSGPQQHGMPDSAIATGAVDIVAPVEELPGHIIAVQASRRRPPGLVDLPAEQTQAARAAIYALLLRQVGHDFAGYKEKTFLRRVQRRMQVLGLTTLDAFVARLEDDRQEVVMLFRDLLIGVTSFFRDQDTFAVLKRTVLPRLFEGAGSRGAIRVWVPGCATGEEVYSLAMLLREHADDHPGPAPKIQVFATDIDEPAIQTARAGRYPSTLLNGLSAERLERFFVRGVDGSYTVAKPVRELCTFSAHSLTRDPPFSRINLLSCRNLLIYLDIDLQATVIPAFHYSLAPDGILLLGSSETINRHEGLFVTLDRQHRIFQKRDVATPPLRMTSRLSGDPAQTVAAGRGSGGGARTGRGVLTSWAAGRVLDRYAPPFMVVTADGTAMQYSSRISRFLELPAGQPSQNVLTMARPGLRAPLSAALKEAADSGRAVERPNVAVTGADGSLQRISLLIEPKRETDAEALFLVLFLDATPARTAAAPQGRASAAAGAEDGDAYRNLEAELRDTREQLQSVIEEHETALEELKSANEELHSVNQELQSTNEELEISKEEIQSINEELQIANNQLAAKVDELDRRNSDLKNLFDSTHVATVFLDPYLVIRSFTPAVASIYNLIPGDQGRPLTDIVSRLRYTSLREDCRYVLQTLEPLERRVVRDDEQAHYLMRVLPYRTPENRVDGTIVTFVDVTGIVQAEQHQRLLVDELNHRVKNMLTVVISMATQTIRRSDSLEDFSGNFMGRIHALNAAYSLLSSEGWQTVPLRALLLEELKPFITDEGDNVTLDGPLVLLEPRSALALGLAFHELTTNAVKHGALSVPDGRVAVGWRIEPGADAAAAAPDLVITWIESGGPPVLPPRRHGFGMTLIERGLKQEMSAQVELEFAPEGVRTTIRAQLGRPPVPPPRPTDP